jgi:protein-tyrosine phosphatase
MAVHIISPPFQPTRIFSRLLLGTLWNVKHLAEGEHNVGLVVNCTDETVPRLPKVSMIQLGLLDGYEVAPNKIEYAIRILRQFFEISHEREVLVCCHASQSRSPAIILAYLLSIGMGLAEAEAFLQGKHPKTFIAPEILKSIRQYFGYAPKTVEDFVRCTDWKETGKVQ